MAFMSATARNLSLYSHFGGGHHPLALTTLYFGLTVGDPFLTTSEPNFAAGYARVAVGNDASTWGAVTRTDDTVTLRVNIVFPKSTGIWTGPGGGGFFYYWTIYSAATGGALWYSAALQNGIIDVSAAGITPMIPAGGIVLRQDG